MVIQVFIHLAAGYNELDIVMQMSYKHHMIVFDASTIILLAKVDLFETFVSNFRGPVLIPERVRVEVCKEGKNETPLIVKLIEEKKLNVLKVKNSNLVKKLMEDFTIDAGEAEVLTLALLKKASIIATDDRNAIRACKFLKVDFTTAIAFLIRAFKKKLIDKDEALLKLQKLASIARYKKVIVNDARNQIEGAT